MKTQEMKVINPHAAGIDIGSKSHYVGIGQNLTDFNEFFGLMSDKKRRAAALKNKKDKTVF